MAHCHCVSGLPEKFKMANHAQKVADPWPIQRGSELCRTMTPVNDSIWFAKHLKNVSFPYCSCASDYSFACLHVGSCAIGCWTLGIGSHWSAGHDVHLKMSKNCYDTFI